MKTSLSNRFYGPQTTPVVSRCRRIRDPISYQQPSTVSGEAQLPLASLVVGGEDSAFEGDGEGV